MFFENTIKALETNMKKYLILLLIISAHLLQAQIPALSFWSNIRNSSYTEEDQIHIRSETVDLPGLETEMFYTTSAGWQNIDMTNVNGLTYEAVIPAIPDDTQYCRFRTVTDTLVGMMPSFHENDVFPADIDLGLIDEDPLGDNLDPDVPDLDLTGNYFGYSNTRFYTGISNSTGSYPLDVGGLFPDTYYFYVTTIINPETVLIDSVVYAMIYGDIPLFLDSGLYKIGGTEFSLEAFELIGDIEVEVVNGQLQLACDIETLTNDEDFGEWPNITNTIGVEMFTARLVIPTDFLITDLAKLSLQNIDQYEIAPFTNMLPQISQLNGTNAGLFTCTYFDDNSHFPIIAEVIVDGETYQMNALGYDFSDEVTFEITTGLYGWEEATFRFSDNNYEFVEEIIINNSGIDELLNSQYTLCNYPNPFNPTTIISFDLPEYLSRDIELIIYNMKGQKVKTFPVTLSGVEGSKHNYSIAWNGTDENNQPVSSGIYFYQLIVDGKHVAQNKCLMLK